MAVVTNELMYELLKTVHSDIRPLKAGQAEIKQELISIRGQLISLNQDVTNIYGILARHDDRLDRIESRLELRELGRSSKTIR